MTGKVVPGERPGLRGSGPWKSIPGRVRQLQYEWVIYLIPGFVSMRSLRTLLFFWLISLVGLLWSTFLLAEGVWFWVSLWLVLAIVGSNILVLILRFR
jgi:hypothetical protein